MKEIWKDLPGYEGCYSVSNHGRVKSLARFRENGNYYKEKILIGGLDTDGYRQHIVYNKGQKRVCMKAHRMVLISFVPNKNNHPSINHKNGVKTDNRIDNLEWCTVRHNTSHFYSSKRILPLGVHPSGKKFRSIIAIGHKNINLGSFETVDLASEAYQKALSRL